MSTEHVDSVFKYSIVCHGAAGPQSVQERKMDGGNGDEKETSSENPVHTTHA